MSWVTFGLLVIGLGVLLPMSTFIQAGLFGFYVASFFSLWQVSLLWKWIQTRDWKTWIFLTLASSLVFQLHPISLLQIGVPNLLLYFFYFRSFRWRDQVKLTGAVAVVLLANWYWIHPFIAFSNWRAEAPYFPSSGTIGLMSLIFPMGSTFFESAHFLFQAATLIFSVQSLRQRFFPRPCIGVMVIWIIWLTVISFWGSHLPWIHTLQPGRNLFFLWLFLCVLAGFSLSSLIEGKQPVKFAGVLATLIPFYLFSPFAYSAEKGTGPLTTRMPEYQMNLMTHLKEYYPPSGRLLMETRGLGEPHFSDLVPIWTGQSVIGGPHPGNHMVTQFLVFSGHYFDGVKMVTDEPKAFAKKLKTMTEEVFASYLTLYNVQVVAFRSEEIRKVLAKFSTVLEPLEVLDGTFLYRIKQPPSWFVEGSGDLSFDYDRIDIKKLSKGRVVLKFHWIKTFRSSPALLLKPVYLKDDPVPFIEVDNSSGVKDILIYNAGL
ncbi:MAG: hypothetical protein LHV69_01700 [Elusimicrobia bacterium]|nr:hypothetical protein [Candidatus Obscuribacterium magneticum]